MKLNEEISNDIMKVWERKCPKCNNNIIYSSLSGKYSFKRAQKCNSVCNRCSQIGLKHSNRKTSNYCRGKNHWNYGNNMSNETIEKMRKSLIGRKLTIEHKKNISNGGLGKKRTENTKKKISNSNKGRIMSENQKKKLSEIALKRNRHPMEGKTHSNETKQKIRLKYMDRLHKIFGQIVVPNFNEAACKFIDKLNEEKGWNLQHALNGGEVELYGYFVDGYDKERNIIVEYDERKHYNIYGRLREKDIHRMNEIINHLHCKFYRYNEKTKELKEHI